MIIMYCGDKWFTKMEKSKYNIFIYYLRTEKFPKKQVLNNNNNNNNNI